MHWLHWLHWLQGFGQQLLQPARIPRPPSKTATIRILRILVIGLRASY